MDYPRPIKDLYCSSSTSMCSSVSTISCSISSMRSISTIEGATVNKPVSSLSCLGLHCDEEDEEELNSSRWQLDHHDLRSGGRDSPATKRSPKAPARPPQSPTKLSPHHTRKPAWQLREELKRKGDTTKDDGSRDFTPKMPSRSMRPEHQKKEADQERDRGISVDREEVEVIISSRRKQLMRRIEEIQSMLDSSKPTSHSVPSLFEDACRTISRNNSTKRNTSSERGVLPEYASHPPRMPVRVVSQVLPPEDITIGSNDSSHSTKSPKTSKKSKTKSSSSTSTRRAKRKKKSVGSSDENLAPAVQHRSTHQPQKGEKIINKEQVVREPPNRSSRSRSRSPNINKEQIVREPPNRSSRSRSRSPKKPQRPTHTLTVGTPTTKATKSYIRRGVLKRHKSELRFRRDFIKNSLSSILEDENENLSPIGDVNRRRRHIAVSQSCPSVFVSFDDSELEGCAASMTLLLDDCSGRSSQQHQARCWQGVGSRSLAVNC